MYTLLDVMDHTHPYYNKTAISKSILSKKSSAAMIIVVIIRIVIAFSQFGNVLYYDKCCYYTVLAGK